MKAGRRNVIAGLLAAKNPQRVIHSLEYDISAPTDDKPFFFHMAKSRDALRHTYQVAEAGSKKKPWNVKWYGTFVLIAVLFIATTLAVLCILIPLFLKRADLHGVSGNKAKTARATRLTVPTTMK